MRRRTQGFTLIEIMVVIAIIAGLVTAVAVMVPKMQETQRKTSCMGNLGQLGGVFLTRKMENPARATKYSGVALWLSYRKDGSDVRRGDEKALWCPGDNGVQLPANDDEKKKWDNVDLDNPQDGLCSYAARDFKNAQLNIESKDKEIIGCDRQGSNGHTMQHKGGICIVYDAGDAGFLLREELGVSAEEDVAIGAEAKDPRLQKVVYIAKKHD